MVITQLAAKFPRIVFYSHHLEIQIPTGAYKTSKILKIKIVPPMVYKEIVIWKKRLTLFITWKYRKCLLIKEKKKGNELKLSHPVHLRSSVLPMEYFTFPIQLSVVRK